MPNQYVCSLLVLLLVIPFVEGAPTGGKVKEILKDGKELIASGLTRAHHALTCCHFPSKKAKPAEHEKPPNPRKMGKTLHPATPDIVTPTSSDGPPNPREIGESLHPGTPGIVTPTSSDEPPNPREIGKTLHPATPDIDAPMSSDEPPNPRKIGESLPPGTPDARRRHPVALGLGMDGMETTVHSTHLLHIRVLEERKHVSRVYRRELPGLNAD
jgi:hypothetical protein